MKQNTYQICLTFDQILAVVQQLSEVDKEKLKQELDKLIPKSNNQALLNVFEKIGRDAQAKGLTEEILEELLADES